MSNILDIFRKVYSKRGDLLLELTYQELSTLNKIISIALLSGKIQLDETVSSIHEKISREIEKRGESFATEE